MTPDVELLRRTPEILAWLTADLDDADARWKPAPDRWSVLEVVGHLGVIEDRGFREYALPDVAVPGGWHRIEIACESGSSDPAPRGGACPEGQPARAGDDPSPGPR